jgi:hypothetical protein
VPSGSYRLRGELSVDGRRVAPIEKEIDFKGGPGGDSLAYDTALLLEPGAVHMNIVPGATRTSILRIENPGADPVIVKMSSATPRGLIGVAMGDLLGTSFSAEPWTQIIPSEFTIRPGTKQNVRVMSRIPQDGVNHPHYYADLVMSGAYADGQSAGETRSTVDLSNKAIAAAPDGVVEQVALAEGSEPDQYFAQVRFTNTGNVHLAPTTRLFLLSAQGGQLRNVELTGDEGLLLPLNKRIFSGELSLKGIEPGYYALRALVEIADDKNITSQQPIRVEAEQLTGADGKTMTVSKVTLIYSKTPGRPEDMEKQMEGGSAVPAGRQDGKGSAG